jgi:DNA repair protein RecO (recombination protein O)
MNVKTRGIVFHHIKYNDTSLIATIFTESAGRKSFLIKGVYKSKAPVKASFFQPLSLMEMEISVSVKRELQRVKEVVPSPALHTLHSHPSKQAIVFFIAEVLYKTVREEEQNTSLFEFLYYSILYLDACDTDISNYHLVFMLQLSRYLGFSPMDNYSEGTPVFDVFNGSFVPESLGNEYTYSKRLSSKLHTLIRLNFETSSQLNLNRIERVELLEMILELYRLHLHSNLNIQSLQILKELFD